MKKNYSSPTIVTLSEEALKRIIVARACSQFVCDVWVMNCVGPNLVGFDADAYNCWYQGLGYDINKCLSASQFAT